MSEKKFKSGFVSVIGRPNVGKSSLINELIGHKVSIVTNKPQTTRNNIRGILNVPGEYQIVFVDTPGFHTAKDGIDKLMNSSAFQSLKDTDIILFLAPVDEKIGKNDLYILEQLKKQTNIPQFLVLTKADLLPKEALIQKVTEWKKLFNPDETILISSTTRKNIDTLLELILRDLPNDFAFFAPDQITDQPNRFYIKELIREQVLLKTGQEVPHSVAVLVDELEDDGELMQIRATIFVERDSQKGILIGKNGKKIQDIKYKVKKELVTIYQKEVELQLWVKVERDWKKSASLIKKMGYDKNKY